MASVHQCERKPVRSAAFQAETKKKALIGVCDLYLSFSDSYLLVLPLSPTIVVFSVGDSDNYSFPTSTKVFCTPVNLLGVAFTILNPLNRKQ